MNTNAQFHQPDGTLPPNLCSSDAAGQRAEEVGSPNEQAMATNQPEVALAKLPERVALVKAPPQKLANRFASLDAEQSRKMFADISEAIRGRAEEFACACNGAAERWDEMTPHLSHMQSLLSQRGEERQAVLREAGLPTWTEWFEGFKKDIGLKVSLRAVHKNRGKVREYSLGGNGGKTKGHRQVVKTDREKASYKHGYQTGKAEVQKQLDAAAEKRSALAKRIGDLERENEKLQGIADELQQQLQESREKAVGKLPSHVEKLKGIADLAAEAFRIINGKYGERLMGNADGNRLVAIAKKAAAMKAKVKVC